MDLREKFLDTMRQCPQLYRDKFAGDEFYYLNDAIKKKWKGIKFFAESGASKGVFIFPEAEMVIKIPFNYSNFDGKFTGANCQMEWNYCQLEADLYLEAVDNKVDECFAKTTRIGRIGKYPIYQQEYIELLNASDEREPSNKVIEKASSVSDEYCIDTINETWLGTVLEIFGETFYRKLLSFLETYNIEDLHTDNIGYLRGIPTILDYAGFND